MGEWRRSSQCASGECIEVKRAANGQWVWLRTADPLVGGLPVTPEEWVTFVAGVKAGEFDDV